MTRKNML